MGYGWGMGGSKTSSWRRRVGSATGHTRGVGLPDRTNDTATMIHTDTGSLSLGDL